MDLPDYVKTGFYDWPTYVKEVLSADVGVIPYSPGKLHFSLTMPAKTFDYMAAGKPLVLRNLEDVSKLLTEFNCGLVAKNWKEFSHHLRTLYQDRELARQLGSNGRAAVEKHFDYEAIAGGLLEQLYLGHSKHSPCNAWRGIAEP
jgi:glycosyltransferase involved in cell wall biosynthesis